MCRHFYSNFKFYIGHNEINMQQFNLQIYPQVDATKPEFQQTKSLDFETKGKNENFSSISVLSFLPSSTEIFFYSVLLIVLLYICCYYLHCCSQYFMFVCLFYNLICVRSVKNFIFFYFLLPHVIIIDVYSLFLYLYMCL